MSRQTANSRKKIVKKRTSTLQKDDTRTIAEIAKEVCLEITKPVVLQESAGRSKSKARDILLASEAECRAFLGSGKTYKQLSEKFEKAGVHITVKQIGSVFGTKRKDVMRLELAHRKVSSELANFNRTQRMREITETLRKPLPSAPNERLMEMQRREKVLAEFTAAEKALELLASQSHMQTDLSQENERSLLSPVHIEGKAHLELQFDEVPMPIAHEKIEDLGTDPTLVATEPIFAPPPSHNTEMGHQSRNANSQAHIERDDAQTACAMSTPMPDSSPHAPISAPIQA